MTKLFESKYWPMLGRPRSICLIPKFIFIGGRRRICCLTLFRIIARMPANNDLTKSLLFQEELHFLGLRRIWKCAFFRIYQIYQTLDLWLQSSLLLFMIKASLIFALPQCTSWMISRVYYFTSITNLTQLDILFGHFFLLKKGFI